MKAKITFLIILLNAFISEAQVMNTTTMDTVENTVIGNFGLGGYIDTYYGYNFNKPPDGKLPYFVSSANHNEVNINLAYIDLSYRSKSLRARFVPGFGTYINANYATEPGSLKNIVEGNVGVKLFEKKNIWLDAGVLGSPYTNESAISKDHLMYTRSLAPENVPYYLAGAKLTLPLNAKWTAYLYFLNGWQVIQDNNKQKSLGTQLEFRPSQKMLFNWNTYFGDERSVLHPDYRKRFFADVFWIFKPNSKFEATSCVYVGFQQRESAATKNWWQVNFIGRYSFNKKLSLSGRLEHFHDAANIMQSTVTGFSGYKTYSAGLCMNVKVNSSALFRTEYRQFFSGDPIYQNEKLNPLKSSGWLIASLTAWF